MGITWEFPMLTRYKSSINTIPRIRLIKSSYARTILPVSLLTRDRIIILHRRQDRGQELKKDDEVLIDPHAPATRLLHHLDDLHHDVAMLARVDRGMRHVFMGMGLDGDGLFGMVLRNVFKDLD